jgi:thioredoxin 1
MRLGKLRGWFWLLALGLLLCVAWPAAADEYAVPGKITLLELGSPTCPPCRAMAPILEEIEREYRGKIAIVKVDLRYEPEAAQRFGVRMIPTQIYFDKTGREVYRHFGYMNKSGIKAVFFSLGIE